MLYISKGLKTLVQALFLGDVHQFCGPWNKSAGVTQVGCTGGAQQLHEKNRGVCVEVRSLRHAPVFVNVPPPDGCL